MYWLYLCAQCDSVNQYIYPGLIIGSNIIYDIQNDTSTMYQNRTHQWQMKSRTVVVHFTSTHNAGTTLIPDPFNIKSLLLYPGHEYDTTNNNNTVVWVGDTSDTFLCRWVILETWYMIDPHSLTVENWAPYLDLLFNTLQIIVWAVTVTLFLTVKGVICVSVMLY